MQPPKPVRVAVILAGAGAKGAYEAGVLRVLARSNVEIVRIVAASSGALNGVMLADAVRGGDLPARADQLADLWRDRAGWAQVFRPSLGLVGTRRGVSDSTKVLHLLRAQVSPQPVGAEINLRVLVAPLGGVTREIGDQPATSYEALRDFTGSDFTTQASLEDVFQAAAASAAFPLVFGPVEIAGLGPCIDGGAVNNTPIGHALDGAIGDTIERIIVITPTPELHAPPPDLRGIALASHLGNMLIDERLFRDLRETAATNASLRRLIGLVDDGVIEPSQLAQVLAALGWSRRRVVDVVQIRPLAELPGSVFTGFFDHALRAQYLDAGEQRASEVLLR